MTGVGAVVRKAKVSPGASVVVIGCGAVGLNALQGAKLVSAGRVIAVDVGEAKLERAVRFGATDVVDRADRDALERIRALTGGRGADYVFEAAGATHRRSVSRLKPCGPAGKWYGSARSTSTKT
jgi:S-(hydroxymethyl)glutathione dehydrogenase/alcohol dehydrogenase